MSDEPEVTVGDRLEGPHGLIWTVIGLDGEGRRGVIEREETVVHALPLRVSDVGPHGVYRPVKEPIRG